MKYELMLNLYYDLEGPRDDEQALYRANIDKKMYYQCQK
jgi:hypothetical protein